MIIYYILAGYYKTWCVSINTIFAVGKQKGSKHVPGQESSKSQTNTSQKLKQQNLGASFNGLSATPG